MDFMEAKLGSSPSFIWSSITEQGDKDHWSTGQPWLNRVDNPYISTISPSLIDRTVASFFPTGTKDWDMEMIKDILTDNAL